MSYPQLTEYQAAVQNPHLCFFDHPLLKDGKVKSNQLGLPQALSGGFALTYSVECKGQRYAVRCFHREVPDVQHRYEAISKKIQTLSNEYFLRFEYENEGITVNRNRYPIVIMDWANGDTLNSYLSNNINNRSKIEALRLRFRELAKYLKNEGIAHGDVQDLNVICTDTSIKLIDYDGMFVPALNGKKGNEIGHKDYQHPMRDINNFGPQMDYFSFIVLETALSALIASPNLYNKFRSGGEALLFKANDFKDPYDSEVFKEIGKIPTCQQYIENLTKIVLADVDEVPTLQDFIANLNIPSPRATIAANEKPQEVAYITSYDVLDASSYALVEQNVGQKVELIGKVVSVKSSTTTRGKKGRRGQPYIFINFGDWSKESVKLTIWSDALQSFLKKPGAELEGKWISCVGLIDPPYHGKHYGKSYSNVGITIDRESQIQKITKEEADFRLGRKTKKVSTVGQLSPNKGIMPSSNRDILNNLTGNSPNYKNNQNAINASSPRPVSTNKVSTNAQILANLKKDSAAAIPPTKNSPRSNSVHKNSANASKKNYQHQQSNGTKNKTNGPNWLFWAIGLAIAIFIFRSLN